MYKYWEIAKNYETANLQANESFVARYKDASLEDFTLRVKTIWPISFPQFLYFFENEAPSNLLNMCRSVNNDEEPDYDHCHECDEHVTNCICEHENEDDHTCCECYKDLDDCVCDSEVSEDEDCGSDCDDYEE